MIINEDNVTLSTNMLMFEDLPVPVLLRNSKTNKIVYMNAECIKMLYASKDEFLNMEWSVILNKKFNNGTYTKKISLIDNFIKEKKHTYTNVDVNFLLPNGYIWHGNETIRPVFNDNNEIHSFLHIFDPLKMNPIDLMSLYLYLHVNYKTGIQYFLKYLNIDDCFLSTPTKGELIVFLAKMFFQSTNEAAKYLKIQPESLRKVTFQLSKKLLIPKEVMIQRIFKYYGV